MWLVPGGFPVNRLEELAGSNWEPGGTFEAQTVGGLVSEFEGRIPLAGEVLEVGTLRIQVVVSSDRRVEQVRIRVIPAASASEDTKEDRNGRSRPSSGKSEANGIEVE